MFAKTIISYLPPGENTFSSIRELPATKVIPAALPALLLLQLRRRLWHIPGQPAFIPYPLEKRKVNRPVAVPVQAQLPVESYVLLQQLLRLHNCRKSLLQRLQYLIIHILLPQRQLQKSIVFFARLFVHFSASFGFLLFSIPLFPSHISEGVRKSAAVSAPQAL
ncbi:MAG: hypothetical protein GX200_03545 [Firmicutes bacterium]|nr:hypothetical protein [Bacillota bacterium]